MNEYKTWPILLLTGLGVLSLLQSGWAAAPTTKGAWKEIHMIPLAHIVTYAGFHNATFGLTVTGNGAIHYSTNAGNTWPRGTNTSMCLFALEIVDEKTAWTAGNEAHVRFTTDSGATWQKATNFGSVEPHHCRFLSFANPNCGWAATLVKLGYTTDKGKTWREISLPTGVREIRAISLLTPKIGFLLDERSSLYLTEDAGGSWSRLPLAIPITDFDMQSGFVPTAVIRFPQRNHGSIILRRLKPMNQWVEFSTHDGGMTWTQQGIPGEKGSPFLSRDGKTLTLFNLIESRLEVYQRQ